MSRKRNASRNVGNQASKSICIILMLIWFAGGGGVSEAAVRQERAVADSFTDGLKYAGQMFGINTAADVANLVAKAFSNVATSQSNSNSLSSFFQQESQYSTTSQESEESENAGSSFEQQKQQATQETQRQHGVPPAKETVGVDFSSAKIITSVLRMIGFDARKLGALAINALVMIAQAIGTTLMNTFSRRNVGGVTTVDGGRLAETGKTDYDSPSDADENIEHQPRSLRDGTPIDWFLENPSNSMKELLARATNAKLSDEITDMIVEAEKKSKDGENSAACLKMLVCKSSPLIWGMQKSLKKRLNVGNKNATNENENETEDAEDSFMNASIFYRYLPSLEEFREYGDICKQRYGEYCKDASVA